MGKYKIKNDRKRNPKYYYGADMGKKDGDYTVKVSGSVNKNGTYTLEKIKVIKN